VKKSEAIKRTLPVLFGYVPLGMAFGFMLNNQGYGAKIAGLMSLFVYGGSCQYMALELFRSGAPLMTIFVTSLFLSVRHVVYGLTMLEKFRGTGKIKPYLIFALTDEAYALFAAGDFPEDGEKGKTMLLMSALCHFYWVAGSVLGGVLGNYVQFDATGMEFVLTALFIVLTLDMAKSGAGLLPYLIGAGSALVGLSVGANWMMPVAIGLILLSLLALRGRIDKREEDA
jgi:4-azaleucine resistance transporter AzlC